MQWTALQTNNFMEVNNMENNKKENNSLLYKWGDLFGLKATQVFDHHSCQLASAD